MNVPATVAAVLLIGVAPVATAWWCDWRRERRERRARLDVMRREATARMCPSRPHVAGCVVPGCGWISAPVETAPMADLEAVWHRHTHHERTSAL